MEKNDPVKCESVMEIDPKLERLCATGYTEGELLSAIEHRVGENNKIYINPDKLPKYPSSKIEQEGFKYQIPGLDDDDEDRDDYFDDVTANVKRVKFDISPCGEHTHTIKFSKPVTQKAAMLAAEKFLSKPLTQEWYEMVQSDDLDDPWEKAQTEYKCRGDLLSDKVWIEGFKLHRGTLTFSVSG